MGLFDHIFKSKSDDARYWSNKAVLRWSVNRYDDAVKFFNESIKFNSEISSIWYNRGVLLTVIENYKDAITSFDEAISINPNFCSAWLDRGIACNKLGQYDDAINSFDEAIKINPDFYDEWLNSLENPNKYYPYNSPEGMLYRPKQIDIQCRCCYATDITWKEVVRIPSGSQLKIFGTNTCQNCHHFWAGCPKCYSTIKVFRDILWRHDYGSRVIEDGTNYCENCGHIWHYSIDQNKYSGGIPA